MNKLLLNNSGKALLYVVIVVLAIVAIGMFFVGKYNGMVKQKEEVSNAFKQVDVQLQRRYDLIPNLVETVKGYASHEKDIFIKVTEARSKVGQATTEKEKITANNELTSALSRLLLVVENYPDLKANQNFLALQDELAGTENRLSVERRRYNETVKVFNQFIKIFPNNILASFFSFAPAEYLETPKETKEVPKVVF